MKQNRIPRDVYEGLMKRAREMRSKPTQAEEKLWTYLKKRQIGGLRFRRQHIIHTYIVDFFSYDANLIIEIDGPIHQMQLDYDRVREDNLTSLGYKILRFTNQQVMDEIDDVIDAIRKYFFLNK